MNIKDIPWLSERLLNIYLLREKGKTFTEIGRMYSRSSTAIRYNYDSLY